MHLLRALLGAAALVAIPSIASAATLFDQTNLPNQTNTSITQTFIAGAASTTLSLAGYDVPSWIYADNIELTLSGSLSNLLGQTWTFTPAAFGSDAHTDGVGAYGTDNLALGGTAAGYYDTFSQTVDTTPGDSYTLNFLLSSYSVPNGFRVTATNTVSGVPEPATWAMMLLGFGAIGFGMRRKAKQKPNSSPQFA